MLLRRKCIRQRREASAIEEDIDQQDWTWYVEAFLHCSIVLVALHELNPVFNKFCTAPSLVSTIRSTGFRKPLLAQTMYIFKQPRIGGAGIFRVCVLSRDADASSFSAPR